MIRLRDGKSTQTPKWIDRYEYAAPFKTEQYRGALAISASSPYIDDAKTGDVHTVVSTLENPYAVRKPMAITIQTADDGFLARFDSANINASGDTWFEAVSNLKSLIVDIFADLEMQAPNVLGPAIKKQLAALRNHIERKPDA